MEIQGISTTLICQLFHSHLGWARHTTAWPLLSQFSPSWHFFTFWKSCKILLSQFSPFWYLLHFENPEKFYSPNFPLFDIFPPFENPAKFCEWFKSHQIGLDRKLSDATWFFIVFFFFLKCNYLHPYHSRWPMYLQRKAGIF